MQVAIVIWHTMQLVMEDDHLAVLLVLAWQIIWSIYIIILKAVLEEKGFIKGEFLKFLDMEW